jgi:hypothetical protein
MLLSRAIAPSTIGRSTPVNQVVAPEHHETTSLPTARRRWALRGLRVAGVTAATALSAFALPVVGVDVDAAAAQSCWNGCNDWDRDDLRRQIREDRAEIRDDQREIRQDEADIRRDVQRGDYGALERDLRELHEDRAELRDDRRDLREDQQAARQDSRGSSSNSSHHHGR